MGVWGIAGDRFPACGIPAPDLTGVPGVSDVRWTAPGRLSLSLTGPPAAALRAIAAADVTSIDVREPTLEEIFLEYYGETGT